MGVDRCSQGDKDVGLPVALGDAISVQIRAPLPAVFIRFQRREFDTGGQPLAVQYHNFYRHSGPFKWYENCVLAKASLYAYKNSRLSRQNNR